MCASRRNRRNDHTKTCTNAAANQSALDTALHTIFSRRTPNHRARAATNNGRPTQGINKALALADKLCRNPHARRTHARHKVKGKVSNRVLVGKLVSGLALGLHISSISIARRIWQGLQKAGARQQVTRACAAGGNARQGLIVKRK